MLWMPEEAGEAGEAGEGEGEAGEAGEGEGEAGAVTLEVGVALPPIGVALAASPLLQI